MGFLDGFFLSVFSDGQRQDHIVGLYLFGQLGCIPTQFFPPSQYLIHTASCFFGANLSYASMSAFIILSTVIPDNRCRYQRLYQLSVRAKKAKKGMRTQRILLRKDAPSRTLFRWLNSNYYTEFLVVDADFRPLGIFSECDLERLPSEVYGGSVSDVIAACSNQKSGKTSKNP